MESVASTLFAAVVVLGLLILVHELGHFLLAKLSGVAVLRFSIGFGPRVVGRRIGETEYVLSLVPLGGYVKMLGEDEEGGDSAVAAAERERSFAAQPLYKRFAIVLAGPVFNLGFAWIALVLVAGSYGVLKASQEPRVGGVTPGLPAARSGIRSGDRVLSVDGQAVDTWEALAERILSSGGRPVTLRLRRGEEILEVAVTPERQVNRNLFGEDLGEVYRIGIERAMETESVSWAAAPWVAAQQTWFYGELVALSLAKMLLGKISVRELGGPITIARVAGERAQGGLKALLEFMAFLGVNLAVLNLLPIPVLDGGHLLFFAIEAVTRRPVQARTREMAQQVGLFVLVSLMLFAMYNDISRWIEG
jgi:regulator of sigma E protease